jgi:hypothetical protein
MGTRTLCWEIVAAGQAGITVFLSRSDGSLLPGVNYVSPNASQELQYVAVADFNQDGNLDIAAADSDNSAVQIFTGVGDGTFTLGPSLASGQSEDQPEGIVVADFNHDGFPDIAVANINDGTQDVGVLLNDGTGNFPRRRHLQPVQFLQRRRHRCGRSE